MPAPPDEYARLAALYDPATAWALAPMRRRMARLAAGSQSPAGMPVLDVCCGTGVQCLHFARLGLRAVGLDLSPAMLSRAATLPRGPYGPRFVRGDATALPFPDASFGFVCVTLALHEKPPAMRPLILREMVRLTRPGGALAVADYLSPPRWPGLAAAPGVNMVERLAGREHHAFYRDFMTSGGLEGLLAAGGLTPYSLEPCLAGLAGIALFKP